MPYSVQQPNTGVGYPTSYSQVPGSTYMPTVPMPTLPAGPGQQPAYPPVAPTSIMSTGAAPTYPPASAQVGGNLSLWTNHFWKDFSCPNKLTLLVINSMTPGIFEWNFRLVISVIGG